MPKVKVHYWKNHQHKKKHAKQINMSRNENPCYPSKHSETTQMATGYLQPDRLNTHFSNALLKICTA